MSSIFVILNSICNTKNILSKDYIEENYTGSYILLRFISFIKTDENTNKNILLFLNKLNKKFIGDKYDEYLYLLNVFPKIGKIKTSYIKTESIKPNLLLNKKIKYFAQLLEISEKECKYLVDEGYLNVEKIKL